MQKIEKGDFVQCNALKCRPKGTVEAIHEDGTVVARVCDQDRPKCNFDMLAYFGECFTLVTKASKPAPRRELFARFYNDDYIGVAKTKDELDHKYATRGMVADVAMIETRPGDMIVNRAALEDYLQDWLKDFSHKGNPVGFALGKNIVSCFLGSRTL